MKDDGWIFEFQKRMAASLRRLYDHDFTAMPHKITEALHRLRDREDKKDKPSRH